MRRLLVLIVLVAVGSVAPSQPRAQPVSDTARVPYGAKIVWSMQWGVASMQGDFQQTVGAQQGIFRGSLGLRTPSGFTGGLHLATSQLQKRTETATLDSGLDVNLKTTTSFSRIGLFGQYGPWLGRLRPYVEGILGIHVLNTKTKIPGNSNESPNQKTHKESVAPAAGIAVGLNLRLHEVKGGSVGLQLEARHVYGGTADYLYSEDGGEFKERSSSTTTSALSIGLTLDY